MSNFADCEVSVLTPTGRGAVATIGISGHAATALVDQFFRSSSGQSIASAQFNRILFGHWQRNSTAEEVVLCRKNETRCEVHCHGGRAAAAAIAADLVSAGAIEVDWREWIRRDCHDLLQAEALWALAASATERCADVLLDQYHGALRRALEQLETLIAAQDLHPSMELLSSLIKRLRIGLHLTQPFQVALLGAPNVGKSSLLNQLLGYQRSIVFDQPGTTRDVVSAITAFDGWPIELLDTAGLRDTTDPLEAAGAQRAAATARDADLVLLVTDSIEMALNFPTIAACDERVVSIKVLNKIDQLPPDVNAPHNWLPTSALTGEGIARLAQEITDRLVPDSPRPSEPVPFSIRHQELLSNIGDLMARGDWNLAQSLLRELIGANAASG